jgi:hypothetical protein
MISKMKYKNQVKIILKYVLKYIFIKSFIFTLDIAIVNKSQNSS